MKFHLFRQFLYNYSVQELLTNIITLEKQKKAVRNDINLGVKLK